MDYNEYRKRQEKETPRSMVVTVVSALSSIASASVAVCLVVIAFEEPQIDWIMLLYAVTALLSCIILALCAISGRAKDFLDALFWSL